MTTLIAEIYIEEMEKWKDMLEIHDQQLQEMEGWMKDLLRTGTTAKLGAVVEDYINQIGLAKYHDAQLQKQIKMFEEQLYEKHIPLRNDLLSGTMHSNAKSLRTALYHNELTYQRLMFNCDDLLAEVVAERIDWNTGWIRPAARQFCNPETQF